MPQDSLLRTIRERRSAIAGDVARMSADLAALQTEDDRLRVAEEVIVGFSGGAIAAPENRPTKGRRKGKARVGRPKSVDRPANIPGTPDMIYEALRVASSNGRNSLRPEEIRDFIRDKYWPGVQFDAIGPTAWRMGKDGRLAKGDGVYSLPTNEAPAGDTAGASRSGPAINGAAHPPSPPDRGRSGGEVVLSG